MTALPRWVWALLAFLVAVVVYLAKAYFRANQRSAMNSKRASIHHDHVNAVLKSATRKDRRVLDLQREKMASDIEYQVQRDAIDEAAAEDRDALAAKWAEVFRRRKK